MTPTLPSESADPDRDLEVGAGVGEYRIEGKLGQGGFGAVWKASHPLIGKLVAIKVLSMRFSVDREMVSRFVAEARAVNQIRHRNIIDIFSFGQLPDGRHYYVMEYIDGEPLDRRIARARFSLLEALPILRAIARALDAAHHKGIAHRDLKAENVFLGLDPDGAVFPKLLDFGIAKLTGPAGEVGHRTRTGAPMGTPYYMSPEQTRGRDVDHRTDHYAFGVLAYLMLTGRFPLDGEDYMTILMRQVHDDPAPASSHVAELPAGVDHALAWLMRKAPAERPPDLLTAVTALEQAAELIGPGSGEPAAHSGPRIQLPAAITGEPAAASAPALAVTAADREPPARTPGTRRFGLVAAALAVIAVAAVVVVVAVSRPGGGEAGTAGGRANAGERAGVAAAAPGSAAPAPASVTAPAPAPPEPEPLPARVTITLDGVPAGTAVYAGGQLLGTAPRIQLPRGSDELVLVIAADGYQPTSLPIVPDRDVRRAVKLKPRAGRPPARPAPRAGSASDEPTDDIESFPQP